MNLTAGYLYIVLISTSNIVVKDPMVGLFFFPVDSQDYFHVCSSYGEALCPWRVAFLVPAPLVGRLFHPGAQSSEVDGSQMRLFLGNVQRVGLTSSGLSQFFVKKNKIFPTTLIHPIYFLNTWFLITDLVSKSSLTDFHNFFLLGGSLEKKLNNGNI